MIQVYAKEFINICRYLERIGCEKRGGRFYVEKGQLQELLERNNYERAQIKLKIWKELKWLVADEGHMTKRIYVGQGKYQRIYVIDVGIYQSIKQLIRNENTAFGGGHK